MELLNIDVVVLIYVDFFEDVLERETSLFEHLDDMVENFVLGVFLFTLNFELLEHFTIVLVVEVFELFIMQDAAMVDVDLLEQSSDFILSQTQVKEVTKVQMEVAQAKISVLEGIEFHKGLFNRHRQLNLALYAAEHFD